MTAYIQADIFKQRLVQFMYTVMYRRMLNCMSSQNVDLLDMAFAVTTLINTITLRLSNNLVSWDHCLSFASHNMQTIY